MFTPQEVSEKVFPKASFGSGGYSMSSVDEFLDALTEDYSTLFKENVTLKAKLKVLAEKVEEYRSTEDAMRQTLLTAQKMAAKLVQEAQAEKDRMLSGAKAEAAQEIQRLESEKQAAQQKLAMAQEKLAEFIRRSDELCQAQSAFLQTLPELELVPAAAETAEKPADDLHVVHAGVGQCGDNILIQGLALGAGLLGAVQNRDLLGGGGNGLDQLLGCEGAEQTDLHQTDLLAVGVQIVDDLLGHIADGAHGHDDAVSIGSAVVVEQLIVGAQLGVDLVHVLLHHGGQGLVVLVAGLAVLEEDVAVLVGAAHMGMLGVPVLESAGH